METPFAGKGFPQVSPHFFSLSRGVRKPTCLFVPPFSPWPDAPLRGFMKFPFASQAS